MNNLKPFEYDESSEEEEESDQAAEEEDPREEQKDEQPQPEQIDTSIPKVEEVIDTIAATPGVQAEEKPAEDLEQDA